jgi:prevent-host-death family protein
MIIMYSSAIQELDMDAVNVVEARKNFSELLARVAFGGTRIIVERRGKPMAALISIRDLQRLEEYERQAGSARERGLAALGRARALRGAILAESGGQSLPDSADMIREMREQCTDDLSGPP